MTKRLSLRPYNGSLYVCSDEKDYQRAHLRVFGERDVPLVSTGREGRFSGGCGSDGKWAYVIWYTSPHTLAHELSHVVMDDGRYRCLAFLPVACCRRAYLFALSVLQTRRRLYGRATVFLTPSGRRSVPQ